MFEIMNKCRLLQVAIRENKCTPMYRRSLSVIVIKQACGLVVHIRMIVNLTKYISPFADESMSIMLTYM